MAVIRRCRRCVIRVRGNGDSSGEECVSPLLIDDRDT